MENSSKTRRSSVSSGTPSAKQLRQEDRKANSTVANLHARVGQLEVALADAKNTGERNAKRAYEESQAQNAHAAERENVMAGLRHSNAGLLVRIDENSAALATSAQQMRDLSTALVLAHDEEQRRIGRELHDQIGQDLTALKMMLARARNGPSAQVKQTLGEAETLTEELLKTVRNICGTLRPQVLDDLGLVAGVQWHIKTFSARTGMDITFDFGALDETRLSPIVKSMIFRVIQEALTNVSRHAETKMASVMLAMRNGSVDFSIRDGGKGFDIAEALKRGSNGVSGMRERLSLVHGVFEISSSPGQGTVIRAQIPLQPINQLNRRNNGQERSNQSNHS